jgi:hypothetical protein
MSSVKFQELFKILKENLNNAKQIFIKFKLDGKKTKSFQLMEKGK